MSTLLGFGLIIAAVGLFTWSTVQFRRATPPRWTRSDIAANFIVLGLVSGLAFGSAFLIKGLATGGMVGWLELAGLVVVLAVAVVFARRAWRPAPQPRLTPISGGTGGDRPQRPVGGGSDHRRAA